MSLNKHMYNTINTIFKKNVLNSNDEFNKWQ